MIAETQTLEVLLNYKSNVGPGIAKDEAELSGLNATAGKSSAAIGTAERGMSRLSVAANGLGGALSHAKHSIGELITGPLGMVGLGAGLFAVGGLIEKGVEKVNDLATSVEKLTGVTGESAQVASAQIAVFEKYGISVDKVATIAAFAEKTIGKLSETKLKHGVVTSKLIDIDTEYGLHLIDNKGKLVDFQGELLQFADIFNNKLIPTQVRATLAAQLFGRGYVQLVPILKLGSKGILEAEDAAKSLGLTLTKQNANELKNYKESTRELSDAMGGLELQIGLAVVPQLTKLANAADKFLVNGGSKQIAAFFAGGIQLAGEFADAVGAVAPVFGMIAHAWDSLPSQLKTLLITGIVANKASSFLFGINPLSAALKAGGGGVGSIVGDLFKRGGSPANPLFVADVAGGAEGGVAGAAGKAGGLSAIGVAAAVAGGLFVAAQFKGLFLDPANEAQASAAASAAARQRVNIITGSANGKQDLGQSISALKDGIDRLSNIAGPLSSTLYGGEIDKLKAQLAADEKLFTQQSQRPGDRGSKVLPSDAKVLANLAKQGIDLAAIKANAQRAQLVGHSDAVAVGNATRLLGFGIESALHGGFGNVVAAVNGIVGALHALPAFFGTAAAQGRGTAAGGRRTTAASDPKAGHEGQNRGHNVINFRITTDYRSNTGAAAVGSRYGPTPGTAGAV